MKITSIILLNNILSIIVILLGGFITLMPFLPEVQVYVAPLLDDSKGYVYKSELAEQADIPLTALSPVPSNNTLVIPGIGVNGHIVEGNNESMLQKGIWRRPKTSTPDNGGNTVLVAHRYLYTSGPNTFYHLPKMQKGDTFALFWEGKEYDYEVIETKIVPAEALEIEKNTKEPIVTLYTCTPLWSSKERFVVVAKLIE